MSGVAKSSAREQGLQAQGIHRVARYAAGSIFATFCSQTTFVVLYGLLGASTTLSSTLAWVAGAIPNYGLNRTWTWGRRGRPSLTREVLPYAAIILGTLGLAILATGVGETVLDRTSVSHTTETFLVWSIYFFVYVAMFGLRYLLFDRLFRTHDPEPTTPEATEPRRPRREHGRNLIDPGAGRADPGPAD
jgi:putative flippase GtrA